MASSGHTSRDILIVTQAFDPHADELLILLRYMDTGGEVNFMLRVNACYFKTNSVFDFATSIQSGQLHNVPGW